MAYSIKDKVYTDHSMMDEVVYNCKLIMKGILLKNQTAADSYENSQSLADWDNLKNIVEGNYSFLYFPFTTDDFIDFGCDIAQAAYYKYHPEKFPEEDQKTLMEIGTRNFRNNYVEKNNYFRMINGLPFYNTATDEEINKSRRDWIYSDEVVPSPYQKGIIHQYAKYGSNKYGYIYIGANNPKIPTDISNDNPYDDLPYVDTPIHEWNKKQLLLLQRVGILDDVIEEYGKLEQFKYVNYLLRDKLDYYEMRITQPWGILYLPSCEDLVVRQFRNFFETERSLYVRKASGLAFSYGSEYYDQMLGLIIVCQTITDLIVDVPEWFIRRDVFDLRTVQYFLDANDVEFFKEIPLRYQIRIVKNLNKLIEYKSTNTNIEDILDIFSLEGTTVYKYFLIKKFKYNVNSTVTPDKPSKDEDLDDYDFYFEDEIVDTYSTPLKEWNFGSSADDVWVSPDNIVSFDFAHMDELDPYYTPEQTSALEDYKESLKTFTDEYGNVYDLIFARSPIDKNYDNYIRDPMNQFNYDMITENDKYWDGEDVHNYVKNQHLELPYTVMGTKYLRLDYKVSMEKYNFQMAYFLGMLFTTSIDTSDITVLIPAIDSSVSFSLTDIFILLYQLSFAYSNKTCYIKVPTRTRKAKKPDYSNYWLFDGGKAWTGIPYNPPEPDKPEPEDIIIIDDYGCEETDIFNLTYEPDDIDDYGYNVYIDLSDSNIVYEDYGTYELTEYGVSNTLSQPSPEVTSRNLVYITPDHLKEPVKPKETDINLLATPVKRDAILGKGEWMLGTLYDFFDEDPRYIESPKNEIETEPDYDFNVEGYSADTTLTGPHMFDFNDETRLREWETAPLEEYTDKLDGGDVKDKAKDHYRRFIDGGDKRFSVFTHERLYEWMSWRHPDLFVDKTNCIYGFNFKADLQKIANNLNLKHSYYGFRDSVGATLNIAGNIITFPRLVDKKGNAARFIIPMNHKVSTYAELYDIYMINSQCYNIVSDYIANAQTRDLRVMYQYIFDSLFITKFDYTRYLDRMSNVMETYDQVLKNQNYTLYLFYESLMEEPDPTTRQDNIRNVLNSIVDSLEYIIRGNNLDYIYSFLPIYSFNALTHYISLLLDFFKSWKVYFLDPSVTYVVGDNGSGKRNKVIKADMMTEFKKSHWLGDRNNLRDFASICYSLLFKEPHTEFIPKELYQVYSYYSGDISTAGRFDGGLPATTVTHLQNARRTTFDPTLLDGGDSYSKIANPTYKITGKDVADGLDIHNLDGGSAYDTQYPVKIDGGDITENTNWNDPYIIYNPVHGYTVGPRESITDTVWLHSRLQTISATIKLSHKRTNAFIVSKDSTDANGNTIKGGLYLKDNMPTAVEVNDLYEDMKAVWTEQYNHLETNYEYSEAVKSDDNLRDYIFRVTESMLSTSQAVQKDFANSTSENAIYKSIKDPMIAYQNDFDNRNPFKWKYF